jgi:aryl-alcohol dehydrogenase-like predicted oxidoreductase
VPPELNRDRGRIRSGTGSLAHLEDNMAAGSIALIDEDLAELAVAGPSR